MSSHPHRQLELYEFAVGKHGADKLQPFLDSVYEAERWEIVRGWLAVVLVVLGVPCWIMAVWPGIIGGELRQVVIGLWATAFLLEMLAVASMRVWRRRSARYRAAPRASLDPE